MNPAILNNLRAEIYALIEAYPEIAEDAQLRADMIEGETGLRDVLSVLERQEAEAEAHFEACSAMIKTLHERAYRHNQRMDSVRTAIQRVMDAAGTTKVVLPQATITLAQGRKKVMEIDREECPETFRRHKWEPDKNAIREALELGEHVPGFTLSNSPPTLTIRRK